MKIIGAYCMGLIRFKSLQGLKKAYWAEKGSKEIRLERAHFAKMGFLGSLPSLGLNEIRQGLLGLQTVH